MDRSGVDSPGIVFRVILFFVSCSATPHPMESQRSAEGEETRTGPRCKDVKKPTSIEAKTSSRQSIGDAIEKPQRL